MSNYEKAGPLDGAIDDAVREMMQVDPRPGLRHRVAGAIGARPRGAVGVHRLAWGTALALVVLASVLLLRQPDPAQPVIAPPVAVTPAATPPLPAVAAPQPLDTPRQAPDTARRRQAAPEAIFGPRGDRVAAASVPMPRVASPTGSPEAAIEPPPVSGGWSIPPITVTPIHVAPIAIEPLTLGGVPDRR